MCVSERAFPGEAIFQAHLKSEPVRRTRHKTHCLPVNMSVQNATHSFVRMLQEGKEWMSSYCCLADVNLCFTPRYLVLHPSRSVPSFTYPKHSIRLPGPKVMTVIHRKSLRPPEWNC